METSPPFQACSGPCLWASEDLSPARQFSLSCTSEPQLPRSVEGWCRLPGRCAGQEHPKAMGTKQGAWSWGSSPGTALGMQKASCLWAARPKQGALFSTRKAKPRETSNRAVRGRWEMAPGRGNSCLQQNRHRKKEKLSIKCTRGHHTRVLFAQQRSSLLLSPRASFPALIHPGSASLSELIRSMHF